LSTIARWINEHLADKGYSATITEGHYNTDRKYGRLRWPGKGRTGNKLTVWHNGNVVHEHNAADPYRRNEDMERWLAKLVKLGRPPRWNE
jgi:hypothetical protein